MNLIEVMSEWVCTFRGARTPLALGNAKCSIEDVIACMFAGAKTPEASAVRKTMGSLGSGPAKVLGAAAKAPLPFAALANGTAAHALDYDDTFMLGASHASAVLVPALLALTAEIESNGTRLIDAYIVGLQVQYYMALGCMRSHGDIGWHSTATLGAIGGAAACAYLMELDLGQTAAALSLSASMAGGMKVQFGTGAKPLHAGLAAQHAVQAALLAREGLSGSSDALDGPMGFLELCGGDRAPGWQHIDFKAAGRVLAIEREGLMIKRFPCCAATHRAIDCALELQERHAIAPDDIKAIDTHIGHGHARNLMYPIPQDYVEARFSMQYCVSAALHGRGLGLNDFTPDALLRPDVLALMPAVQVHAYPPELSDQAHRVVIHLNDGSMIQGERKHAIGTMHSPLGEAERKKKFWDCCADLSDEHRDELWTLLQRLEHLPSCNVLTALL